MDSEGAFEQVSFWKNLVEWGTPPSLKPLTGARFAKMLCKILSRKGLEVKILIAKNLRAFGRGDACTARALTMICLLFIEGKVRCHIGL